jgi:hypothetical protein
MSKNKIRRINSNKRLFFIFFFFQLDRVGKMLSEIKRLRYIGTSNKYESARAGVA